MKRGPKTWPAPARFSPPSAVPQISVGHTPTTTQGGAQGQPEEKPPVRTLESTELPIPRAIVAILEQHLNEMHLIQVEMAKTIVSRLEHIEHRIKNQDITLHRLERKLDHAAEIKS